MNWTRWKKYDRAGRIGEGVAQWAITQSSEGYDQKDGHTEMDL
jgi:hypothetical protein